MTRATRTKAHPALRTRPFRGLLLGWSLTNLADSILLLILAVWVRDLTGSDALAGLMFAAIGLPALFSPLLGQMADRVSRRVMLTWTYVIGSVGVLPLFLVHDASGVPLVFVVAVVYSGVGFATSAAQSGLLRDMVPDESLAEANGRLTTIDQSFRVLMPFVGAGVYAFAGPLPLVVVASFAFAVAAIVIFRIQVLETPPSTAAEREGLVAEALAGFRHLLRTPPLGALTVALCVGFAATGLVNATMFAVLGNLDLEAHMLGPVNAAQGVAGIVAGVFAGRLIGRFGAPTVIAIGLAATGLGLVPLAGTSLIPALIGIAVIGAGVILAVIAFITQRQMQTPETLQGRVAAATNALMSIPQLLLTVVAASLMTLVDFRVLVLLTAVGMLVAGALAWRARHVWTPAPTSAPSLDGAR